MRISRWRAFRKVVPFATLTVAVAVLCAASGSVATTRSPVPSLASAARAAVTAAQASAEPPVNVPAYRNCADPADWLLRNPPLVPASAFLAGWSDAAKLNGSLGLGYPEPALGKSAGSGEGKQGGITIIAPLAYLCTRVLLQLDYHGLRELPPERATFLAYGFMPVTATVQFVQPGPRDFSACVEPNGTTSPDCPPLTAVVAADDTPTSADYQHYQVVSTAQLSLRISDVTVNGTALRVGGSCQTGPVTTPGNPIGYDGVVLTGGNVPGDPEPQYANPFFGGALDGSARIPPVSGCGSNGDLDPLLNAAISGPGNYIRIVQSLLCTTGAIVGSCASDGVTPTVGPLWTVTNGGAFSGSSGAVAFTTSFLDKTRKIACADSAVSGSVPDFSGPPRGALGTMGWTFGDCVGYGRNGRPDGSTWTVAQQGTGLIDGVGSSVASDIAGSVGLKLVGASLVFRGWGGQTGGTEQHPCQIIMTGEPGIRYTNPFGSSAAELETLTEAAYTLEPTISSTCADVLARFPMHLPTAIYKLRAGSGMTITNVPPPSP